MYRSVRIANNAKAQPACPPPLKQNRPASVALENFEPKFEKKVAKRTGQVKVPPKHIRQKKVKKQVGQQRTITGKGVAMRPNFGFLDFLVKNRAGRTSEKPIKSEVPVGKTSPDRIFGVLTRSTSRVHTRYISVHSY